MQSLRNVLVGANHPKLHAYFCPLYLFRMDFEPTDSIWFVSDANFFEQFSTGDLEMIIIAFILKHHQPNLMLQLTLQHFVINVDWFLSFLMVYRRPHRRHNYDDWPD